MPDSSESPIMTRESLEQSRLILSDEKNSSSQSWARSGQWFHRALQATLPMKVLRNTDKRDSSKAPSPAVLSLLTLERNSSRSEEMTLLLRIERLLSRIDWKIDSTSRC